MKACLVGLLLAMETVDEKYNITKYFKIQLRSLVYPLNQKNMNSEWANNSSSLEYLSENVETKLAHHNQNT